MTKKLKFWTGLGVAAVSGAMIAEAAAFDTSMKTAPLAKGKFLLMADASGEAGESGAAKGADHVDYLTDLAMVEGYMLVAVELYRLGEAEAAKTHMRHPADELYKEVESHFGELQVAGFAAELEAVGKAVEQGAAAADVEALAAKLQAAIAAARGGEPSSAESAKIVVSLLRHAADDYEAGVKDGKVVEAHEYQDAWGFVQAAKGLLAAMPQGERAEHAGPVGEIEAELTKLGAAFPDLTGRTAISADPTLLPAAAARIELAALDIR